MAFFEGKEMTGGYGGPDIITSCTVDVNRGEIVAILGPNGAGKSTVMKAMLGLINLKSGTVTIGGKDISNLSPQDRVKQGISFVPQTRNVFTGLSVKENLEMGAFLRKEDLEKVIEEIYQLFPILKEKQSQLVGELSGGQRQQVASQCGLILAMGPQCYQDKERYPEGPWCKKGDWVMFARYAGSRIKIEGGEIRLLNDDEILATIKSPEDLLHEF